MTPVLEGQWMMLRLRGKYVPHVVLYKGNSLKKNYKYIIIIRIIHF
jgi:hypothetical protein